MVLADVQGHSIVILKTITATTIAVDAICVIVITANTAVPTSKRVGDACTIYVVDEQHGQHSDW